MSELQILIFNAAVFSILAVYHYWKNRKLNIAFYILAYYSICAWGALLYHEHELCHYMRGRETYSIIPFLYLIPVILLFAYPIIRYDNTRITRIETLNSNFFINLVWILLFIQIVLYIILFPSFLKAILSSNIGDYRNDTYDESEIVQFPNYFFNILCRLYMGARNVVILIAAYGLLVIKTHRKLLKIFLVTSLCFPVYMFTAYASRAVMIMTFFFLVFIFVFLSVFMNVGLKKKIVSYLILILVPISSAFILISNSRFGNLATYMFYRYLGESFNNYNTHFFYELKGNTWGEAYFVFFRKLMGISSNFKTTREKWEWLDNITGVDTHVFYTFVGGLNIEFGFVGTIVIGLLLSFFMVKKMRPYNVLTLPKFIALGMLACTLINGVFFFVLQGDWGNLEILFTLFFCFLFSKYRTRKYINK